MRAGFITLIGRPNAGKSTLLNAIMGQKVSIISSKPQTTRNRILGIHNSEDMQAVLVDTPGVHEARGRLNRAMVQVATDALSGVDAVCWVLDTTGPVRRAAKGGPAIGRPEEAILRLIEGSGVDKITVALNKIDAVRRERLLPVLAALGERLPDAEIVPLSALKKDGIDRLLAVWRSQLPEGAPLFPPEQLTEVSERFVVSELIREKVFALTHQEIPYATAVQIELFKEEQRKGKPPLIHIMARIIVERDSQKGIVIGKGGARLRLIGTQARHDIETLLGAKIFLELHVSVTDGWSESPRMLRELGYK